MPIRAALAHGGQERGVDPEVSGALGQVDPRDGRRLVPAPGPAPVELLEDVLGQDDHADQVRVMGVVVDVIVQDAAGTQGCEQRLAVDHQGVVAAPDGLDGLAEIGRAAHRGSIEVAGREEMRPGLLPSARRAKPPRQAIVPLGELRVLIDQPPEGGGRRGGIGRLEGPRGPERALEFRSGRGRRPGGQYRAIGREPPSFDPGTIRMGTAPIRSQ